MLVILMVKYIYCLLYTSWEIYPEGMYHVLKKFSKYPIKEILVTENGCCFDDVVEAVSYTHLDVYKRQTERKN